MPLADVRTKLAAMEEKAADAVPGVYDAMRSPMLCHAEDEGPSGPGCPTWPLR